MRITNKRLMGKMDTLLRKEEAGLLSHKKGSRVLRKLLSNHLSVIGFVIFFVILLSSIFAPLLTSYGPLQIDLKEILSSPSVKHLLGTDKLGRDVFTRILYGGRISILIGFGSAIGAASIGILAGSYGGYKGGWVDKLFLRLSEIFMSFPQIVLVLLIVTIVGQSMTNLIFIFIGTGWGSCI